jgi:hypothetical protein
MFINTEIFRTNIKLWKRLMIHSEKLLTFLKHEDVPATNNGSERAIRNAKIHRTHIPQ